MKPLHVRLLAVSVWRHGPFQTDPFVSPEQGRRIDSVTRHAIPWRALGRGHFCIVPNAEDL